LSATPTGSAKGAALLADWGASVERFWQLVPPSEAGTPEASVEAEKRALECETEAECSVQGVAMEAASSAA
jgi:hypothetical protein